MACRMSFPQGIIIIIIILISMYSRCHSDDYSPQELQALYHLRAAFNDPFLNKNWSGIICFKGYPSQGYGIQCDINNGRVTAIVLEDMHLSGEINSNALVDMAELQAVSFRNNLISSGNLIDFSSNHNLKVVDLSTNRFFGQISSSLLSLESLESLRLQDNKLTGPIPPFNQSSLKVFNVSNNSLSGSIPNTKTLRSFGSDSYSDNPELCGPPTSTSCNKSTGPEPPNSDGAGVGAGAGAGAGSGSGHFKFIFFLFAAIFIITVFLVLIFYLKKSVRRKIIVIKKEEYAEQEKESSGDGREKIETNIANAGKRKLVVPGEDNNRKLIFIDDDDDDEHPAGFRLDDLLKAPAEGLGKGIFGNSFKAMLEGRAPVVVKRLRDLKPLSNEEFTKQLLVIAHQKHPNLLPLLAYFCSKDEKLLVYKYAENGNLFDRIHGGKSSNNRIPFRWRSRLSVATSVARALQHLHHNSRTKSEVIHGNLKPSNILLDDNEMVVVSDYGFSSLVALPIAAQRMISYKSPEYQSSKKISRKSDVWSYGCLVLELLTGRISQHSAPPGTNGVDLSSWVLRAVREEWTGEIFEPEISSKRRSASRGMLKLLQVAIQCCNKTPEHRPEMTEVVRELENIMAIESSEEDDDFSLSQSLTDESPSICASASQRP